MAPVQHSPPSAPAEAALAAAREAVVSCELCPRLRSYCRRIATDKKAAHRHETYWGRPVPGFGDPNARLLVVGLAPAAHGANRTGRVFTGDGSGDFLMAAMHAAGFANIATAQNTSDGLALRDAYILSVVRCAPPDNKPAPDEIVRCRQHLAREIAALPAVQVVVALGKIAFDGYLAYFAQQARLAEQGRLAQQGRPASLPPVKDVGAQLRRKPSFGHGVVVELGPSLPTLIGSYHPSRQNTNTGKLTPPMLAAIFAEARRRLGEPPNPPKPPRPALSRASS